MNRRTGFMVAALCGLLSFGIPCPAAEQPEDKTVKETQTPPPPSIELSIIGKLYLEFPEKLDGRNAKDRRELLAGGEFESDPKRQQWLFVQGLRMWRFTQGSEREAVLVDSTQTNGLVLALGTGADVQLYPINELDAAGYAPKKLAELWKGMGDYRVNLQERSLSILEKIGGEPLATIAWNGKTFDLPSSVAESQPAPASSPEPAPGFKLEDGEYAVNGIRFHLWMVHYGTSPQGTHAPARVTDNQAVLTVHARIVEAAEAEKLSKIKAWVTDKGGVRYDLASTLSNEQNGEITWVFAVPKTAKSLLLHFATGETLSLAPWVKKQGAASADGTGDSENDSSARAILPAFTEVLSGTNELQIHNPNDFFVLAGIRDGTRGKDLRLPAKGFAVVYLPIGTYEISYVYGNKPDAIYQKDRLSMGSKGAIIRLKNGQTNVNSQATPQPE